MTAPAAPSLRPARTPTRSMLLAGVLSCAPLVVLVPLLTWAAAGGWAAVSALLGAVISLAIFVMGVVGIRGVLTGPTATTMAGAFGVFVLQMAVLAAVIWSLGQTEWLQILPLVLAFVLVGLVFQVGLVIGFLRSRAELDVSLPGPAG